MKVLVGFISIVVFVSVLLLVEKNKLLAQGIYPHERIPGEIWLDNGDDGYYPGTRLRVEGIENNGFREASEPAVKPKEVGVEFQVDNGRVEVSAERLTIYVYEGYHELRVKIPESFLQDRAVVYNVGSQTYSDYNVQRGVKSGAISYVGGNFYQARNIGDNTFEIPFVNSSYMLGLRINIGIQTIPQACRQKCNAEPIVISYENSCGEPVAMPGRTNIAEAVRYIPMDTDERYIWALVETWASCKNTYEMTLLKVDKTTGTLVSAFTFEDGYINNWGTLASNIISLDGAIWVNFSRLQDARLYKISQESGAVLGFKEFGGGSKDSTVIATDGTFVFVAGIGPAVTIVDKETLEYVGGGSTCGFAESVGYDGEYIYTICTEETGNFHDPAPKHFVAKNVLLDQVSEKTNRRLKTFRTLEVASIDAFQAVDLQTLFNTYNGRLLYIGINSYFNYLLKYDPAANNLHRTESIFPRAPQPLTADDRGHTWGISRYFGGLLEFNDESESFESCMVNVPYYHTGLSGVTFDGKYLWTVAGGIYIPRAFYKVTPYDTCEAPPDNPPECQLTAGKSTLTPGEATLINGTASDPEGEATFWESWNSTGGLLDSSLGEPPKTWTAPGESGTYMITADVSAGGKNATCSTEVRVEAPEPACWIEGPNIVAPSDRAVYRAHALNILGGVVPQWKNWSASCGQFDPEDGQGTIEAGGHLNIIDWLAPAASQGCILEVELSADEGQSFNACQLLVNGEYKAWLQLKDGDIYSGYLREGGLYLGDYGIDIFLPYSPSPLTPSQRFERFFLADTTDLNGLADSGDLRGGIPFARELIRASDGIEERLTERQWRFEKYPKILWPKEVLERVQKEIETGRNIFGDLQIYYFSSNLDITATEPDFVFRSEPKIVMVDNDISIADVQGESRRIYGIFFAGRRIEFSAGNYPEPVFVNGAMHANMGGFVLDRKLGDNQEPAIVVEADPRYFFLSIPVLSRSEYGWREIKPL